MKTFIKENLVEARETLDKFIGEPGNIAAIENAAKILIEAVNSGHKIISCGNGGSMTDAMHFAEELSGVFREQRPSIPAVSISDPSHITCAANDYGFENIFSRYIEGLGQQGDVLVAVSTSGNSENVIRAAEVAGKRGMKIVALTGKTGGRLAGMADQEIRVKGGRYSDRIQEMHIKILHILVGLIELSIDEK